MQRPRITKKLALALEEGLGLLTGDYEAIACDPSFPIETREGVKRTLDYLEATIRWAKAQERKETK